MSGHAPSPQSATVVNRPGAQGARLRTAGCVAEAACDRWWPLVSPGDERGTCRGAVGWTRQVGKNDGREW